MRPYLVEGDKEALDLFSQIRGAAGLVAAGQMTLEMTAASGTSKA